MTYEFDLTELEFGLIRDFIHERFGICFSNEKRSFVRMKLYPRVVGLGLGSFGEYLSLVKYGPDGNRELARMISALTNNETYFFRESGQLEAFRNSLLPESREKKLREAEKKIKILSAGCSTGEEVYTLAMLAFETGSFFWGWDIRITGIDIDETALETARRAVYYDRSFRMTDPYFAQKFFSRNTAGYEARRNIKAMVSFRNGNIADPETWESVGDMDMIFCRNVLIYFSDEKVKTAVGHFYRALRSGGYLLLGHSETLTGISHRFEIVRHPETIVYRK